MSIVYTALRRAGLRFLYCTDLGDLCSFYRLSPIDIAPTSIKSFVAFRVMCYLYKWFYSLVLFRYFHRIQYYESTSPFVICAQKGTLVQGGVGPFGLKVLASKRLEEYTSVFFRIFKGQNNKYVVLMCSDQSRSSLYKKNDKANYGAFLNVDPTKDKLFLRTLIDHSIVESFGGQGKTCITARVYPTIAIEDKAHFYAFNYGKEDVQISSFNAWSMKKAQIS